MRADHPRCGELLPRRAILALFGACLVAFGAVACGTETKDAPRPLTVFAAASLTDVLPELAKAWKENGGVDARFSFGATSKLVPQVIEGAPADLLFSADEDWMSKLDAAGKVQAGTRAIVARNELVFVVPSTASKAPASGADLPGDLRKIALAGENVPAGKYAKAALEKAGTWEKVRPLMVRGEDVRLTLRWVASGEADAGVVYRTDALAEPKVKVAFAFPADSHAPIVYPAAVVKGAASATDAARFLEFCRSAKAAPIFQKYGFLPPSP